MRILHRGAMAICGVVASESFLAYDRNPPGMPRTSRSPPVRSGGKQHSSVTLEGIPRSALHLTLPEQAPTPQYSDTLLARPIRRRHAEMPPPAGPFRGVVAAKVTPETPAPPQGGLGDQGRHEMEVLHLQRLPVVPRGFV